MKTKTMDSQKNRLKYFYICYDALSDPFLVFAGYRRFGNSVEGYMLLDSGTIYYGILRLASVKTPVRL